MFDLLVILSLVSSVTWGFVAVLLGHRPPFDTFSGRFFVAFALFIGVYALFDGLAKAFDSPGDALLALRLSFFSLTLAPAFLFIYARGMARAQSRWDFLIIPASFFWLAVVLGPMVEGVVLEPEGLQPLLHIEYYSMWVSWLTAISLAGLYFLLLDEAVLRQVWAQHRRRLAIFSVAMASILAVGLGTNFLRQVAGLPVPELLSSFLFIPAIGLILLFLADSRDEFLKAIRSSVPRRYSVLQGFLVYRGGKLLGSMSRASEMGVDEDVMTGMLQAIQAFVGQSFPFVEDGSLKAIEQADMRLIVEKGRFCHLVLVVRGREDEFLRALMRAVLRRFEIDHFDFLTDWRGDCSTVPDCEPLFQPFHVSRAAA